MSNPEDFHVGYKKPPIHSRFKSGQSGNPRGRPKKPTVTSELASELNRKIKVRENGVEQQTTKSAALAKSLVARALGGDMRAIGYLIQLLPAQFQAPAEAVDATISAADAAALERFVERRFAAINTSHTQNPAPQQPIPDKENENEH